jgi:hypothetical protein
MLKEVPKKLGCLILSWPSWRAVAQSGLRCSFSGGKNRQKFAQNMPNFFRRKKMSEVSNLQSRASSLSLFSGLGTSSVSGGSGDALFLLFSRNPETEN